MLRTFIHFLKFRALCHNRKWFHLLPLPLVLYPIWNSPAGLVYFSLFYIKVWDNSWYFGLLRNHRLHLTLTLCLCSLCPQFSQAAWQNFYFLPVKHGTTRCGVFAPRRRGVGLCLRDLSSTLRPSVPLTHCFPAASICLTPCCPTTSSHLSSHCCLLQNCFKSSNQLQDVLLLYGLLKRLLSVTHGQVTTGVMCV